MTSLPNDMDAGVIAFLNPFRSATRIEVLLDWQDCVSGQARAWPPKGLLDTLLDFTVRIVASKNAPDWSDGQAAPHCDLSLKRTFLMPDDRKKYAHFVQEVWEKTWKDLKECPAGQVARNFPEVAVVEAKADKRFSLHAAPHLSDHIHNFPANAPNISQEQLNQWRQETCKKYRAYVEPLLAWRAKLVSSVKSSEVGVEVRSILAPSSTIQDKRRAALRRACRDEITIGHLFQALHFFDLEPLSKDCMAFLDKNHGMPLWLLAMPTDAHHLKFVPIATRIVPNVKNGQYEFLTYLGQMGNVTYDDAWNSYVEGFVGVRPLQGWELANSTPNSMHTETTPYTAGEVLFQTRSVAHLTDLRVLHAQARESVESQVGALDTDRGVTSRVKREETLRRADYVVHAVNSLESAKRPFDSIGITWTRDPQAGANSGTGKPVHTGFKGYRVDVKDLTQKEKASQLMSLCLVDRLAVTDENQEYRFPESTKLAVVEGYVDIPVLKDPSQKQGLDCVAPRDYVTWDGYSVVARNPLDALGKLGKEPNSDGTEDLSDGDQNDVGVFLQDFAKLVVGLSYGHIYHFGIRRVALTEMSRLLSENNLANDPWATLQFLRTVRIARPEVCVQAKSLSPILPIDDVAPGCNGVTEHLANTYKISGPDPKVTIQSRSPMAHWKVAFHAREKLDIDNNEDFKAACRSFALRVLKNSSESDCTSSHTDFLTSVDPHASAVRVVSRVWYPFSKSDGSAGSRGDRYIVSGVDDFGTGNDRRSFAGLVVEGDKLISKRDFSGDLDADVGHDDEVPNDADDPGSPIMYRRYRNRLECSGVWSKDAKGKVLPIALDNISLENVEKGNLSERATIDELQKGVDKWTANVYVFDEGDLNSVPIGGHAIVKPFEVNRIRYGGLQTLDYERWLQVPPTITDTAPVTPCDVTMAQPLARGTISQWRSFVFPKDKNVLPADQLRDTYLKFIQRMASPLKVVAAKDIPVEIGDKNALCIVGENSAILTAMAFSFPGPTNVIEHFSSNNGVPAASVIATLGSFGNHADGVAPKPGDSLNPRRLPFIEDDITWMVSLDWSVPLKNSHLERPTDIACLKEFQLFRTERGVLPKDGDKPLAVLPRPSDQALQYYDLDKVRWFWLDAVQTRDGHQFDYHVIAVPEEVPGDTKNRKAFLSNRWFLFHAEIPCAQFDTRPDPVRCIPLLPTKEVRKMALYLPAETQHRDSIDHTVKFSKIAIRAVSARRDPLLTDELDPPINDEITPSFYFVAGQAPGKKLELSELFPEKTVYDDGSLKSIIATSLSSFGSPYSYEDKGWTWADPYSSSTTQLVATVDKLPQGAFRIHNPFIKLQLSAYSPDKYPRLIHTAPSELYETNWLQLYPDELAQLIREHDRLLITNPSKKIGDQIKTPHLLWYRFHFFLRDISTVTKPPFHLSTFYNDEPFLDLIQVRNALKTALNTFSPAYILDEIEFDVVAEEGLLAGSYALDKDLKTLPSLERLFVTFRATVEALRLGANTVVSDSKRARKAEVGSVH